MTSHQVTSRSRVLGQGDRSAPQPFLHQLAHGRRVRVAGALAHHLANEEAEDAGLAGAVLVGFAGVGGGDLVHDKGQGAGVAHRLQMASQLASASVDSDGCPTHAEGAQ